jgi:hypothetical protein
VRQDEKRRAYVSQQLSRSDQTLTTQSVMGDMGKEAEHLDCDPKNKESNNCSLEKCVMGLMEKGGNTP